MNLNTVIAQLREKATVFGKHVGGASKFDVLPESANLTVPAAYVLPLNEQPEEQSAQNGYQQTVREGFAVVLVVSNRSDERGQGAANEIDVIRKAVFAAILGFQPAEDYDVVTFQGGQLLHIDRARLYYQLDFYADYYLDRTDTWIDRRDSQLPDFERIQIEIDALDVFDPNMPETDFPDDPEAYPGGEGPDGRSEGGLTIDLTSP